MHRGQDLSQCNEFFRLQKQSATKNQRRILMKESAHVHVGPDFRRNPNKVFSDLNRKTKSDSVLIFAKNIHVLRVHVRTASVSRF